MLSLPLLLVSVRWQTYHGGHFRLREIAVFDYAGRFGSRSNGSTVELGRGQLRSRKISMKLLERMNRSRPAVQ